MGVFGFQEQHVCNSIAPGAPWSEVWAFFETAIDQCYVGCAHSLSRMAVYENCMWKTMFGASSQVASEILGALFVVVALVGLSRHKDILCVFTALPGRCGLIMQAYNPCGFRSYTHPGQ